MYPWSRPYVPHAARPLQPHPLSACLPAGTRTRVHERRLRRCRRHRHRRCTYRHRRRMSFRDCICMSYLRPGVNVWACCARHCHRARVYVHQRAASGAQNSIEMYRATTTKLRELRFSLRATAINFSQPGIVSPTPAPFPGTVVAVVVARTRFTT